MNKAKKATKADLPLTKYQHLTTVVSRLFSEGAHNMMRNIWLTTAATAVMVVTLTILLLSSMVNMSLSETVDERTDDFSVGIFLNDGIDEIKLAGLRTALEGKTYISSVTYISKEAAKAKFEEQFKDDEFVQQGLDLSDENILPASFDVRFKDLTKVQEVVTLAKSDEFKPLVYRTSDNEIRSQSITQYLNIQNSVSMGTLLAVIIFGSISVLIVFNTIRMAVFSRSREIEIMKLIGATPNYIRGPFLVEATLYGLISGVIAFSLAYTVLVSLLPNINGIQTTSTINFFSSNWFLVFIGTIVAGVVIGLVSSLLAMAKYLRLKRW